MPIQMLSSLETQGFYIYLFTYLFIYLLLLLFFGRAMWYLQDLISPTRDCTRAPAMKALSPNH